MENRTAVFALTSSAELANEIVGELGIPPGQCDVKHFSDGEIMVGLGGPVRGKNVYIVQSTYAPVSSNTMEVLIAIDACKRTSAGHISIVMPYFGYTRQDRKARSRQPIIFKLVADLLERAGASRVVTMELYATQIQGFFDISADDIPAICIIGQYFKSLNPKDVVVVPPDHGGTTRVRRLAEILHVPLVTTDKRRPKPNVAEVMNIIEDVNGRIAIVVDDIVDTAGMLTAGTQMLHDKGVTAVYASCVYDVLSGPAINRLKAANLEEFVYTNTIPQDDKVTLYPQMKVLSVGSALGQVIKAVEESRLVSEIVARCAE